MKFLVLFLIFFIGCKQQTTSIPTPPPVVEIQPVVPSPKSETEVEPITPPTKTPSKDFLKGYWEGYTNNWWGPIRWTISTDFRSGRALGKKDRKQGMPPRYNPPPSP